MASVKEFKALFTVSDKATPELKKLKASFRSFEKASKSFSKHAKTLGALTLGPLAGAFTALSATVKGSISQFTAYGSSVKDAAIKLGTTTDAIQALRHAAQMAGSSAESLDAGMAIFNKNLANASQGKNKQLVEMFKKLGINMKDANGHMRTTADLMPEIADAMKRQQTQAQKSYIATQLFGKGGQELIQMLEGGSESLKAYEEEARKLGLIMSDEDTWAAKAMGDSMQRMHDSITGFSNTLGSKLVPLLQPIIDNMTEWVAVNRTWIADEITSEVKDLADSLKNIDFKTLVKDVITLTKKGFELFRMLGGLKTVAVVIAGIFAGKLLVSIVGMIGALGSIISAVGALSKAFIAFNAVLLANPIVLIITAIIAAIGALIYIGYQLYKNWDTFKSWFIDMWDKWGNIIKVFALIFSPIVGVIMLAAEQIIKHWEPIKEFFGNICDFLAGVPDRISGAWDSLKDYFSELWQSIKDTFFTPFLTATESIKNFGSSIGNGISSAWDSTKSFFTGSNNSSSGYSVPAATVASAGGTMTGDITVNVKSAEGTEAEVTSTSQRGNGGNIKYRTNSGQLRTL